jgi:hypothetical protein
MKINSEDPRFLYPTSGFQYADYFLQTPCSKLTMPQGLSLWVKTTNGGQRTVMDMAAVRVTG